MTDFILKNRWAIVIFSVILGVGMGLLIPLARTDPEIRNYVPHSMPSRVATDSIEKHFGVQDMIIVLFSDTSVLNSETLGEIKDVDRAFSRLEGIDNINSLYTARKIEGRDGSMIVDPLIKRIPQTDEERKVLRDDILANQFARDIVVSSDMTTAAITGTINKTTPENVTLGKVDSVISSEKGEASIMTGGLPYIRRHIIKDVNHDAVFLIPLALLIMLLLLKLTLGEWKNVFMPFSVVLLSTAVSMGLIPLLGWKISILSLLVPIILISVANNYGIYIVSRHRELTREGKFLTGRDRISAITGMLNMPILFSGLTTIAGVLGLLVHSIIPARQVGMLAAVGISTALLMSLFYLPAMISLTKPAPVGTREKRERYDLIDRISSLVSGIVIKRPGRVLLISLIITLITGTGIFLLKIDTNQEDYFPPRHPVREAAAIINSKFGGSQTISVMVEGDITDPKVMNAIGNLTSQLKKEEGVGNVLSISDVIREISKALYDKGEEGYDHIPETSEGIAQMFELYNMSGNPDDLKQLVTFDRTRAHILIKLSKPENYIIRNLRESIANLTRSFPAKVTTGGYAIIMTDFAGKIIRGQVSSLLFALVTVFILLSVIFRSLKGGLAGSLPLAASIVIQFGFMGLTGIAIDAATALLSSIMIGVGVDFTIQFLWRYNSELRSGLAHKEAVSRTFSTTGRSIIINGLTVMAGFSATFFSGFLSIRFFGYLVLLSIGSCLLFALIVIPAFMLYFKPGFIENDLQIKKHKKERNGKDLHLAGAADVFDGSLSATARSGAVDGKES